MTNDCANVLCKMTAKGLGRCPPQMQNLDKDRNLCLLPPLLIWQCDVNTDEKGMNMIEKAGVAERSQICMGIRKSGYRRIFEGEARAGRGPRATGRGPWTRDAGPRAAGRGPRDAGRGTSRDVGRGTRAAGRGPRDAGRGTRAAGHGPRDRGTRAAGRGPRAAGHGLRDTGRGPRSAGSMPRSALRRLHAAVMQDLLEKLPKDEFKEVVKDLNKYPKP